MSKIITHWHDRVLVVTLNRPAAHNAFDHEMVVKLRDIFSSVDQMDSKPHAVVLQSEGKTFCAGGDLNDMRTLGKADYETNLESARELAEMFRAIRLCSVPVVARVQGSAFGGGVGLICSCDIAVAAEGSLLALTEARLGLVAGVISPMVIGKIGLAAARTLCLTGDQIDVTEAHRIGMIDRVCEPENLDDTVHKVVESLLKGGPTALANIKRLIEGVQSLTFDESFEFTAKMIAEARTSDEAQSALDAFFNKKPAPWINDD